MKKQKQNLMDMIPECLHGYEEKEDGTIQVLLPRFQWKKKKKWLLPRMKRPYIKILLDSMGTLVWKNIDGNKTVYQISKKICEIMGEKEDENWHRRMAIFFQMLKRRDLIKFKSMQKF